MVWRTGCDIFGAVRRDGARLQVARRRLTALHIAKLRDSYRDNLFVEDEFKTPVREAHALGKTELERIKRKLAALRAWEVVIRAFRGVKAVDCVALSGIIDI